MSSPTATETHVSTLFFTSDRVFKLLKPVVTGFLDHSDTATRIRAAELELELNRRMAPDVYLGLADVVEGDELVDRMIVMRRLPADRSMTALIARGGLTHDHVRAVARAVAAFHAGLDPILDPGGPGSLAVQSVNWTDSFTEIKPFIGTVLDPVTESRIEYLAEQYMVGHAELFANRVTEGFVRNGHGDLLADDIFCLDDGPRILDCLAFDERFRVGDVLSDIAFLAMDLHRLSGPAIASALIRDYCEFSGEHHPGSLAHHYVAYRAFVRCKVACLRVGQGAPEFGAVARMYHRLTLDQLERARARVVLIGGGPGTGKTSVATRLGEQYDWPVLSSDEIRKDLAKVDRYQHRPAEPDEGIYAPEFTKASYAELIRRADLILRSGDSVVIDASWTRNEHRDQARNIAADHAAELIEVECRVDPGVARERVARRLADPWNVSDATPAIVDHIESMHDPWPEAFSLDTGRPIDETISELVHLVQKSSARAEPASAPRPRSPATDFWGTYVAYSQLDSVRPFTTVIAVEGGPNEYTSPPPTEGAAAATLRE